MAEQIYRIRIRFSTGKNVFFVNAMSPERALTEDQLLAQRFMSETNVNQIMQQIVDGGGQHSGPAQYFNRLKLRILSLEPGQRISIHIDYARILPDGLAGVWSEMPKGGVFINNGGKQHCA